MESYNLINVPNVKVIKGIIISGGVRIASSFNCSLKNRNGLRDYFFYPQNPKSIPSMKLNRSEPQYYKLRLTTGHASSSPRRKFQRVAIRAIFWYD